MTNANRPANSESPDCVPLFGALVLRMPSARSLLRGARPVLGILLAASAASCEAGTQYTVRYAPEWRPARNTVAVFGVFQGGRMSPDAWYPLSSRVSAAFGRTSACPAAFGDTLRRADPELYSKLDEDVAANGIAEDILEGVAGKTDAEVIVTLSVHGRVDKVRAPSVGADPTMPGYRPGAGGRTGRRQRGGQVVGWSGLELSASLYSVKLRRAVGRITLLYSGTSMDEAVTQFSAKLAEELPGSTCHGWAWSKAP
jgi:hypothetical protein